MKNNVAIYGGLAGTEAPGYNMSLRNFITNESILSGDIGAGGNADNSYSVVKGSGTNNTAILDGFTVSGGNANETNTSFTNPERCGGGMFLLLQKPLPKRSVQPWNWQSAHLPRPGQKHLLCHGAGTQYFIHRYKWDNCN